MQLMAIQLILYRTHGTRQGMIALPRCLSGHMISFSISITNYIVSIIYTR